jgi:hypothetical protein
LSTQDVLSEISTESVDRWLQAARNAEPHRFDEYDAAYTEAQMVAGPEVLVAIHELNGASVHGTFLRVSGKQGDIEVKKAAREKLLNSARQEQERYYAEI